MLVASDEDRELEAADAAITKSAEKVAQLKPTSTPVFDTLSGDKASVAKSVADGLVSVLTNLDGMKKIVDLLADVSSPLSMTALK